MSAGKRIHAAFLALVLASGGVLAQPASLSDGEVRRVDKAARKVTLRHGPLKNLDMPAMTMVFEVRDTPLLDRVKPGDRVKFMADKVDGAFVVRVLEPAR
jgi:Cu/Ag efflux protein CusF